MSSNTWGTEMAKRDWNRAALVTHALIVGGSLTIAGSATAQSWPDHDRKIEQWAARQVSGKLGDLRGSFGHETEIVKETVHESYARPKQRPKPATRIFVLPRAGEALPPVVSNDVLPAGVDPVLTGSTDGPPPGVDPIVTGTAKKLPPGVDPIITGGTSQLPPGVDPIVTGSNTRPTGAAVASDNGHPVESQRMPWINSRLVVN